MHLAGRVTGKQPCSVGKPIAASRRASDTAHAQACCSLQSSGSHTPSDSPSQGTTRRSVLGVSAATIAAASSGLLWLPSHAIAAEATQQRALGRTLDAFQQRLDDQVVDFTLPNGMQFVVMPRRDAPIVSCHTFANVGAFQEETGSTGIAHLLEHMAFKGTTTVGTSNWALEQPLLDAQDEVFQELQEALRTAPADTKRPAALRAQLAALGREADRHSVANEYAQILTDAGGVGLNAQTGHDATKYFVSLPSNKLELWFALEGARWQDPVWRQLHKEKEVVLEERRLRVDSSPNGKFLETFQSIAIGNNYARPVVGYEADIRSLGRPQLDAFFRRHYHPINLTVAIVGDVDPDAVYALAQRHFGAWRPDAAALGRRSAPDTGLRKTTGGVLMPVSNSLMAPGSVPSESPLNWKALSARPADLSALNNTLELASQAGPGANLCFYRPQASPIGTSVALEALTDVASGGRTARLYKSLVTTDKALGASCVAGYPSDKYPCMLVASAVPVDGRNVEAMAADTRAVFDALAQERVTPTELRRVKLESQLALAQAAQSNSRMASVLALYNGSFGSWRSVLQELQSTQSLTEEVLLDTAQATFAPENTFTALMPRL